MLPIWFWAFWNSINLLTWYKCSYLHVPTVCLDIWIGPNKNVVDGEKDGQEGHGENVNGHREKSPDFLLMIYCFNVLDQHVILVEVPETGIMTPLVVVVVVDFGSQVRPHSLNCSLASLTTKHSNKLLFCITDYKSQTTRRNLKHLVNKNKDKH